MMTTMMNIHVLMMKLMMSIINNACLLPVYAERGRCTPPQLQ